MMKGLASLLLVAVLLCFGVEYGGTAGSLVTHRFPLGAIGCLFTNRLCGPGQECVDDHLFGTCQDRASARDYYQYLLDRKTLGALEKEIWLLIQKGYSWRDAFAQCVLQNILVSYRQQTNFDRSVCAKPSKWSYDTEEDVSNVLQSLFNYYSRVRGSGSRIPAIEAPPSQEYNIPDYSSQKRDEFLKIHKYFDPSKSEWKRTPYPPPTFEDYLVEKEVENVLKDASRDVVNYDDLTDDDLAKLRLYLEALQEATQNNNEDVVEYPDENSSESEREFETSQDPSSLDLLDDSRGEAQDGGGAFWSSPSIETPRSAEEPEGQWHDEPLPGIDLSILDTAESPDNNVAAFPTQQDEVSPQEELLRKGEGLEESANEISENGLTPHYAKLLADLLQDDLDPGSLSDKELDHLTNIVNSLLSDLAKEEDSMVADFRDIKDSPQADQSTYTEDEVIKPPTSAIKSLVAEDMSSGEGAGENPTGENLMVKKAETPVSYETPSKEEKENDEPPKEGEPKTVSLVDASYVFLTTDRDIGLQEGETLVNGLTRVLGFPPGSLSVTDVHDGRVTFRVSPEVLEIYNGSSIASLAGKHERDLARLTGLNIISAGIGSEDGEIKVEILNNGTSPKFFVLTFVLCGCIAGVLIAVVVIYLVKRHSRSKDKLAQLASEGIGAEASEDYQDLCRQRMQSKTSEKPEPLHAAGRIGSVSESQVRSPSSRSSTSSWSEEPVTSNMDISTGHIVLSYMEDHLKNKGRLDQEWDALAAYEADPCSTFVASDPSNTRKNRYGDIVPYDHSRVVLADSSNVSGSDYINASTITDHDPRNPAYISTQGPLPHTVADFWQMVWEQGSVVVVMLTKLTENGAAMCHRYWPEEGSDLYHIYEVHLVSEHIWCDDYLVRSIYLKNLQTNETRTVTQFHFLTWQDNKVPGSVKALLDFRRKVNKSYRGRSCPIVVHCSDGSGRSGTYTLIDMVLNRLAKGAKEIDIAATLEHIRDQRMAMVKTKEQFEFALAAVAEEVHAILKSLPQ